MTARRGWYVFTRLSDGTTEVYGGPFKSIRAAQAAIYDGMKITCKAIEVELDMWSAADIERRKSILRFPKEAT